MPFWTCFHIGWGPETLQDMFDKKMWSGVLVGTTVNTGNWGSTFWDSNNPIGSSVWGKNAACQKLVLGLHPRLPKRSLAKSDPIQPQKEKRIYVAAKILPSLVSGLWNCPWWRIVINQPAGAVGWDSFFCGWKTGGTWWGVDFDTFGYFWCDLMGKTWIR